MADVSERDGQELPEAVREPFEVEAADAVDGKENNNRRNNDTKMGLTLRILVAVYVLYLAWGLIEGFGETAGNDRILIGAAILIFVIAGGAILLISAKKLIRKEYRDADEGAESTENEEER